jgi:hypothetical protein
VLVKYLGTVVYQTHRLKFLNKKGIAGTNSDDFASFYDKDKNSAIFSRATDNTGNPRSYYQ